MITTRKELDEYLDLEVRSLGFVKRVLRFLKGFATPFARELSLISLYLWCYRCYEYYHNTRKRFGHYIPFLVYGFMLSLLTKKLILFLPINSIGKGLVLHHTFKTQTMVASKSIGRNVTIKSGLILAPNQFGHETEKESSPVVEDFVEFSFNVKAFGPVTIGRGALINANSVIITSIPPYAIVTGNPAKIIGFRAKPDAIAKFEEKEYNVEDRIPLSILESNYKKYYLDRLNEISSFVSIDKCLF